MVSGRSSRTTPRRVALPLPRVLSSLVVRHVRAAGARCARGGRVRVRAFRRCSTERASRPSQASATFAERGARSLARPGGQTPVARCARASAGSSDGPSAVNGPGPLLASDGTGGWVRRVRAGGVVFPSSEGKLLSLTARALFHSHLRQARKRVPRAARSRSLRARSVPALRGVGRWCRVEPGWGPLRARWDRDTGRRRYCFGYS